MHCCFMFFCLLQPNSAFMKKIPKGSEVCNIMVGELDELREPILGFIRLKEARLLEGISEVKLPTRYAANSGLLSLWTVKPML